MYFLVHLGRSVKLGPFVVYDHKNDNLWDGVSDAPHLSRFFEVFEMLLRTKRTGEGKKEGE